MPLSRGEIESVITIKARDQASREFKRAGAELKKWNTEVKKAKGPFDDFTKETKKAEKGVSDLGRTLKGGLAAAGISFGISQIIASSREWTRSMANATLVANAMGPAAVKALAKIAPSFDAIGASADTTGTAARVAWATLVRETGRANISVEDVTNALRIAQVTGLGAAESAEMLGQAMIGNVEPLRRLTGQSGFGSLEKFLKDINIAAQDTDTVVNEVLGATDRLQDKLGELASTGDAGEVPVAPPFISAVILGIEAAEKALSDFHKASVERTWGGIDAIDAILGNPQKFQDPFPVPVGAESAIVKFLDETKWKMTERVAQINATIASQLGNIPPAGVVPGSDVNEAGPGVNPIIGGGIGPDRREGGLPPMAEGGIVTRPTAALIGEAGPEAVIPLSRGGGGMGGVNITINGGTFTDEASVRAQAREIARLLREEQRRGF